MEALEENRIMTLHPQGKKGVNILQRRYDFIKDYILEVLKKEEQISYKELNKRAVQKLKNTFDGKVGWYVVSVKLDLEARDIIERVPKTSPHEIRIKNDKLLLSWRRLRIHRSDLSLSFIQNMLY